MPGTLPARSPWLEQLRAASPPCPLDGDVATDVVVVGGGIAGASTAFFLLRETDQRVLLVERGRVGHGATGHNAGQLATYFERPLTDMVRQYGFEQTIDAQRLMESAWGLIETMADECGTDQRIDRFIGNMGMFNLDHVLVHLRQSALRREGGLAQPQFLVSQSAPFLGDIPTDLHGLYEVVPERRIRDVLGPGTERYCAVLCSPIGAANGALLVERVIEHLQAAHRERFRFVDHTNVHYIGLHADRAEVHADHHTVLARRVVLCTNGFTDHVVENLAGVPLDRGRRVNVIGDVGYMVGVLEPEAGTPHAYSFVRNEHIGDEVSPYVYVTRRPWDTEHGTGMLVVVGGPEQQLASPDDYDPGDAFPVERIAEFDRDIMPLAYPSHRPDDGYAFQWHGLMGYTDTKLRLIGLEPRNPVLLYNLGCNGVGFMPSIVGGHRIARLVAGDSFPQSVFDPPA